MEILIKYDPGFKARPIYFVNVDPDRFSDHMTIKQAEKFAYNMRTLNFTLDNRTGIESFD